MTKKSPNGGKNANSGAGLETGRAILCSVYNLDLMGNCYGKNYTLRSMQWCSRNTRRDDLGEPSGARWTVSEESYQKVITTVMVKNSGKTARFKFVVETKTVISTRLGGHSGQPGQ